MTELITNGLNEKSQYTRTFDKRSKFLARKKIEINEASEEICTCDCDHEISARFDLFFEILEDDLQWPYDNGEFPLKYYENPILETGSDELDFVTKAILFDIFCQYADFDKNDDVAHEKLGIRQKILTLDLLYDYWSVKEEYEISYTGIKNALLFLADRNIIKIITPTELSCQSKNGIVLRLVAPMILFLYAFIDKHEAADARYILKSIDCENLSADEKARKISRIFGKIGTFSIQRHEFLLYRLSRLREEASRGE